MEKNERELIRSAGNALSNHLENELKEMFQKYSDDLVHSIIEQEIHNTEGVRAVKVSKSGMMVFSSTISPLVRAIDLTNGRELWHHRHHQDTVRSIYIDEKNPRHENRIFTTSWDHSVVFTDLNGRFLSRLNQDSGRMPSLDYNPTLDLVLTGSYDHDINPKFFNRAKLWNAHTGQLLAIFPHNPRLAVETIQVAFDKRNDELLYTGSDDAQIFQWNLKGMLCGHYEGCRGSVRSITTTLRGLLVVTSSDNFIRAWDIDSREMVMEINAFNSDAIQVAIPKDELSLIACSFDGSIKAFELPSGKLIRTYEEPALHKDKWALILTEDERLLLSGSVQGTIVFFDYATGEQLATFFALRNTQDFLWIGHNDNACSRGCDCFYTNNPDRFIRIYHRDNEQEPLSAEEKDKYLKKFNDPVYFFERLWNHQTFSGDKTKSLRFLDPKHFDRLQLGSGQP